MTHPKGKLLSQDIAAGAVRLRSARLCIFHYHSTRQACQHMREHIIILDSYVCVEEMFVPSINKLSFLDPFVSFVILTN